MLFNSAEFLIFFPIVTILYFLLPHRFRWLHLLLASCIFYCAFIPAYILILFFTIVVDYIAGIYIDKSTGEKKRYFLIVSLVANIGILCVFKYNNFFVDNVNGLLQLFHVNVRPIPFWNIILPLGLSFHTFQAMSYTIEVYRGNQKPEKHFGIYALYVMFYPQLVAGPIERPQNILHQYHEEHSFNPQMMMDGLRLMLWGFFKKIVIADRLAWYVNEVYSDPSHFSSLNIFVALVLFGFQIYCDFSGYSDIALGSAKTMGFNLMINFNRPFLYATSITEFWRRWHISLYTWFNDYLFTPLVIALRDYGKIAVAGSVLITFILSGFWHGADWAFVLFGLFHGIALVYEMYTKKWRKKLSQQIPQPVYYLGSLLITFFVACIIWVFFRSASIHKSLEIFKCLIGNIHLPIAKSVGKRFGSHAMVLSLVFIVFMMTVEKYTSATLEGLGKKRFTDILFCIVVLTLIITFGVFTNNSFIYFQF